MPWKLRALWKRMVRLIAGGGAFDAVVITADGGEREIVVSLRKCRAAR
jgi:hypothetical protein